MDEIIANDEAHKAAFREALMTGEALRWDKFARLTGTSEAAIKRAWLDGALPSCPIDSIPIREGVVALCSIPGALRRQKSGCPVWLLEFDSLARQLLSLPARESASVYSVDASQKSDDELAMYKVSHLKAQTAHALQSAKTKEFDLQVKRGEYVKTSDVELDAAECATNVIGVLQSLPARIGASCAGLSAIEIEQRASAEISKAIGFIQNAAMTGDWS